MATATAGQGQAIIYCRVSDKGQETHGTSLDSQERECIAHAATLGFTVGYVTREVYTGAELWDRRKLSQVRADLKTGQYAALICYSTDRLSRDPIHLAILAEECERAGVALHFASETFDDSDEAALIRYIKGYSSKKEREKIRERGLRGKYQRALNGKIHGHGPELYGYRRDKERGVRVIYEPEALSALDVRVHANGTDPNEWHIAGAVPIGPVEDAAAALVSPGTTSSARYAPRLPRPPALA